MPIHTLHHPELPDQPIRVEVQPGRTLSAEYARAGWVEDTDDDDELQATEPSPPLIEQAPAPLAPPKEM